MNNILTLKGSRFEQRSRNSTIGPITILRSSIINLERLIEIHESLLTVKNFWEQNRFIEGVLVSAYYDRIVAKSNRVRGYLKKSSTTTPNDSIVGAKFNEEKNKHIITHYLSRETLDTTIENSAKAIELFQDYFPSGSLDYEGFADNDFFNNIPYTNYGISKTNFRLILRDSCFVERFGVEEATKEDLKNSIVSFYSVDEDLLSILKSINVNIVSSNILDESTVLLDERNVELVLSKIPFLVSMAVEDFTSLSPDEFHSTMMQFDTSIPFPSKEPTIGVIDTLFDESVYFGNWVEYHDMISDNITKIPKDFCHGTAVSSIIVEGSNLNKNLDDGCGRFKVRHFGVALHNGFNSFSIVKQIREIISQNTDIKVWNLSLGADDEIRENFISAEASVLDALQFEYDVIFVVAGTNATLAKGEIKRIGAPADSLNSLIVNSVDFDNQPAHFSRQGVVLSFFIKPDIAYYGGGNGQFINVCEPLGPARVSGTSYAAPFISRKLAYLIHYIGFNKEEAKALLIDSAIEWNSKRTFEEKTLIGNGIVPIKINDILTTPEDEIKFVVSDISEKYDSYNYNFPVPTSADKYPFVAKATMCYFPRCSRNQGVDYTNSELNLTFGRLTETGISPINNDNQNMDDAPGYIREDSARNIFRKWDNVKHIGESFTPRKQPKPILNGVNPQWGMSVKTIERLPGRDGEGIRFGIVVTLKEIHGENRIEDFINQALLRGWLVNKVQIENQIDVYNRLHEEIEFE